MRRILGAILILFVTSAVSLGAETFCQSSITDKTVVVFGNGIMNTQKDATKSAEKLKKLLKAAISPEEFSKLEFGLAYNQSSTPTRRRLV